MSEPGLVNHHTIKHTFREQIPVILIILFGLGIRWILILINKVPFNSDEAIVGLMARHILQGEHPIFFYGQSYMGSLDSYIVAAFFLIFGKTVTAIRISQSFLLIIFLFLSHRFAYRLLNSRIAALWVLAFLAGAPVNFLLYTTVTLGGYLEALIIGISILLITLEIYPCLTNKTNDQKKLLVNCILLGFMIGIGIWVLGITLVYSLAALIFLFLVIHKYPFPKQKLIHSTLCLAGGGIIGITPIIAYVFGNGINAFLTELFGSAVSVSQPYLSQVWLHAANLFLFGSSTIFGFRPPWEVNWLLLPVIPFILFIWGIILAKIRNHKSDDNDMSWMLVWLPSFLLIVAFILTPFGIDPSGRYFLPIHLSLALSIGFWITRADQMKKIVKWGLPILILTYNVGGIFQSEFQSSDGITTQFAPGTRLDHSYDQELIDFLTSTNNFAGYSTYWTAYPIAFLSDEKITLAPELPYHSDLRYTTRDNRIKTYSDVADKYSDSVYITSNNINLDEKLTLELAQLGVSWQQKIIGDYHVYYGFSRKVLPQEIGFGINNP